MKHQWEKVMIQKENQINFLKTKINLMWKSVKRKMFETTVCDNKLLIVFIKTHQKIQNSMHFELLKIIPGIFPVFQAFLNENPGMQFFLIKDKIMTNG